MATEQSLEVSRAVNDAQDFYAVEERKVEDEDLFESVHAKDTQALKARVLQPGAPAHVRLGRQKGKGIVSGKQETMSKFRTRFGCVVIRLVIKIPISFWANYVPGLAHRVPVFFRRASSRRCLSAQ